MNNSNHTHNQYDTIAKPLMEIGFLPHNFYKGFSISITRTRRW